MWGLSSGEEGQSKWLSFERTMNGEGKKLAFSSKFVLEPLGHMLYTCVTNFGRQSEKVTQVSLHS